MERRKLKPGSLGGIAFRGADDPIFSPDRQVKCLNLPPEGARDSDTNRVLKRLDAATADWPFDRVTLLLNVVERIATAERLRVSRVPKSSPQYRSLANEAKGAAKLAKSLSGLFPNPTEEVRTLIGHLADFTWAALLESLETDHDLAAKAARQSLKEFRSDKSSDIVSNGLIAELVVLALGELPRQVHESDIRNRYVKEHKPPEERVPSVWGRHLALVVEVSHSSFDVGIRSNDIKSAFMSSIHPLLNAPFSTTLWRRPESEPSSIGSVPKKPEQGS